MKIKVNHQILNQNKYFILKSTSLIGFTKIMFSNSDSNLDENSNDGMIEFKRERENSFRTQEKQIQTELVNEGQSFLFLRIISTSFSILDIFPTVSNTDQVVYEELDSDVLYHRSFSHHEVWNE